MVHARPMEVGALKRFRLINKAQLVHFAQLRPYGPWTKKDAELLVEFLMLHSGVKLESWRFLDRLANRRKSLICTIINFVYKNKEMGN